MKSAGDSRFKGSVPKQTRLPLTAFAAFLLVGVPFSTGCDLMAQGACGEEHEDDEDDEDDDDEGGEEDEAGHSAELAIDETLDEELAGLRVTLSFDAESGAFIGMAENVSGARLDEVYLEVELSNEEEIEADPLYLAAGEVVQIDLPVADPNFTTWSASVEVGPEDECS